MSRPSRCCPGTFSKTWGCSKRCPASQSGSDTARGLAQALVHGKPWHWLGVIGLALATGSAALPASQRQGWLLLGVGALGAGGLLASGFAIGATGWSFAWLGAHFGSLPARQFGIALGGALALLTLLMFAGTGLARMGGFRGDVFVAGPVLLCSALLLLFVALPMAKSLVGAFFDERGVFSGTAFVDRLAHERVWLLDCLACGVRCDMAWDTLFLALLTAPSIMMPRHADRAVREARQPPAEQATERAGTAADHHAALRGGPRVEFALRPRRARQ